MLVLLPGLLPCLLAFILRLLAVIMSVVLGVAAQRPICSVSCHADCLPNRALLPRPIERAAKEQYTRDKKQGHVSFGPRESPTFDVDRWRERTDDRNLRSGFCNFRL
jgi:hypothetical protein